MNRIIPKLIAILIIIIVISEIYISTISQDFANWDDPKHIAAVWEPSWSRLWTIISDFNLQFTGVKYYSPVHFMSLMFDQYLIYPALVPQPWISKFFNIIFHWINTVLVFFLLSRLGIDTRCSFMGALLFAIHPLQVGTVAWISERKNLLVTLFFLSAMISYISYERTKSNLKMILVFILFVLGLGTKPIMVVFPIVAGAYSYYLTPKIRSGTVQFLFILLAFSFAWSIYAIHTEISVPGMLPSILKRPMLASASLLFYISKLILPTNLVAVHPKWDLDNNLFPFTMALIIVSICVFLYIKYSQKLRPIAQFGIVFFVSSLLPVCGIIPFGYMSHSYVADHFMYLPIVGVAVLSSDMLSFLFARYQYIPKKLIMYQIAVYTVLCVLGIISIKQTLVWRDPIILWETNLEKNPQSPTVLTNYAATLAEKDRLEEAQKHLLKAIELAPFLDVAYVNLASLYERQGKLLEAREVMETALGLNPTNEAYYTRLAQILITQGQRETALDLLEIAEEKLPNSARIKNELGVLYNSLGRRDDAIQMLLAAKKIDPFLHEPYLNLANIYGSDEKYDRALDTLNEALQHTSHLNIIFGLAEIHRKTGNAVAADTELARCHVLVPENVQILSMYSANLVKLGRCDEASRLCINGEKCSPETMLMIEQCKKSSSGN